MGTAFRVVVSVLVVLVVAPAVFAVLLTPKHSHKSAGSRHPSRVNDNMLNFLVLADWGGLPVTPYQTPVELAIAKQMGSVANTVDSKFTLGLGDNFYFDGVKTVDDKRFVETYEKVFDAIALDTPWYFIAGNHDHNGNVSAQIAYTDKVNRWRFPDYYYNLKFEVAAGSSVEIVMIDTVLLCGNSDHDFLHKAPVQKKDAKSVKIADDQWAWIEQTLSQSNANYLIVGGHYPVYSIAEHGSTQCLVDRLFPLLHKYRVQAYLSGHDHNLQHIEVAAKNWTTEYFVVGSANFIEDSKAHINSIPTGSLRYYWADTMKLGGFGVFQLSKDAMTFRFIDAQTGQTLHGQTMNPVNDR